MSVRIVKISERRYEVNQKICFENLDGEWVCPSNDLTPAEEKAFREMLASIDRKIIN